jgi:heme exporter protein A
VGDGTLGVTATVTREGDRQPAIELDRVSKSFGGRTALAAVSLSIGAGETVAMLGPNGAGKTTLLRLVATLAKPTSGAVRIEGLDPARAGAEARRRVGFLSHRTLLYDDLTAEQNLRFYARMYDVGDADTRVAHLLDIVGLSARRHDLVRAYSRGMQQRLALARALLHRPSVLLLDEPYSGLDPVVTDTLTDLLGQLSGHGTTILLTTHDTDQALELGGRLLVLARGKLVYDTPHAQVDAAGFSRLYRQLAA